MVENNRLVSGFVKYRRRELLGINEWLPLTNAISGNGAPIGITDTNTEASGIYRQHIIDPW